LTETEARTTNRRGSDIRDQCIARRTPDTFADAIQAQCERSARSFVCFALTHRFHEIRRVVGNKSVAPRAAHSRKDL
jgi:hypothetical protein